MSSEELFIESKKYLPGGVDSPIRAFKPYPFFASKGVGSKIFDVDGNCYIDYCLGYGPAILGHGHESVVKAVGDQIAIGTTYGAPTEKELQLAKMVAERVPCVEMLRFVNSGTEATMSAIRLARGFTGKNKIVKFDGAYHGCHDHVLIKPGSGGAGRPDSLGVPEDTSKNTLSIPFNEEDALIQLTDKHKDEIATIIVEPVMGNIGCLEPKNGFLKLLRDVTKENDILLIFDEVITGFRLSYGSAQEYFNVAPDLATFGKILGGGFPIGAFGGRNEIMDLIAPSGGVYQAGTFNGNPVSITGGITTLNELNQSFYKSLNMKGEFLRGQIADSIEELSLNLTLAGLTSMFQIYFRDGDILNYEDVKKSDVEKFNLYFKELLKNGVFIPPSQFECCFISNAHNQEDLEKTGKIIHDVLKEIYSCSKKTSVKNVDEYRNFAYNSQDLKNKNNETSYVNQILDENDEIGDEIGNKDEIERFSNYSPDSKLNNDYREYNVEYENDHYFIKKTSYSNKILSSNKTSLYNKVENINDLISKINNLSGWKKLIFEKINNFDSEIFYLNDLYNNFKIFIPAYPKNKDVESAIGYTLTYLISLGLIEPISPGKYRNLAHNSQDFKNKNNEASSQNKEKFSESSSINKLDTNDDNNDSKNMNKSNTFIKLVQSKTNNGNNQDDSDINRNMSNINGNMANNDMSSENLFKSRFASWYSSIALVDHKNWFGDDLESKLDEINNKYYASFYDYLFDVDITNIKNKISKTRHNIQNRRSVMDKAFENYVRMTKGIAKEVIFYYISFLEKELYLESDEIKEEVQGKIVSNKYLDEEVINDEEENNKKYENFLEKKVVEEKFCKLCGEQLPIGFSKSLCKSCQKKIYGVKILKNLLNHVFPEIEFSIDDLINIGFKKIKAKDYIWTLIELNLLNEHEKNRYSLKNQDILEKFIKDNSADESNLNEHNILIPSAKLNKVCIVCNKNLAINKFHKSKNNKDGYQNYCKKCSKSVNAVKYLNKLLLLVDYGEYFDFNDLKNNFNDNIEFSHYVWSIQEFDLISQENGKYVFNNKEKIEEFMKNF